MNLPIPGLMVLVDAILLMRGFITALRVSGLRRQELRKAIVDGNSSQLWSNSTDVPLCWKKWWKSMDPKVRLDNSPILLPDVQLLRDCPTRWSSTYLMIHRYLELFPVSICMNAFLLYSKLILIIIWSTLGGSTDDISKSKRTWSIYHR